LELIDFEICPHYDSSLDKELDDYQKTTVNKIIKISNSQAVIISGNKLQIIG